MSNEDKDEDKDKNNQPEWKHFRVSQGLLIHNGGVLLVANDYGYEDLLWSLPGGRLEIGEQHLDGLVREFYEETGLSVVPGELLYVVDAQSTLHQRHFVTLVFAVRLAHPVPEPEIVCELNGPVKDARFVPIHEIPDYIQRPSMGEGLVNYLCYKDKAPRYWHYSEYLTPHWTPLQWPSLP